MKKKALILGLTGCDGAYLAKYLLEKDYIVEGINQGNNLNNLSKLNIVKKINLYKIKNYSGKKFYRIIKSNYDEIYFFDDKPNSYRLNKNDQKIYENNIIPSKVILNFIRNQKKKKTKFLFSASSEIFVKTKNNKYLRKKKNIIPTSRYDLSKLLVYEIIKSYRKMYNLPIYSLILLNNKNVKNNKSHIFKTINKSFTSKKKIKTTKFFIGNIEIDFSRIAEYAITCSKILNKKEIGDYTIKNGKIILIKNIGL